MIDRKAFRLMFVALLALVVSVPAMAADKGTKVEQEIEKLDMAWGEAAAKGDGAVLNKLLADDLYHVHASGNIEDKATYVSSLVSGKRKHDPIVPQDVKVRVYGDTAVSTGKFKMVAYKEGMPKPMVDQVNLYTHVWRKTAKGWQITVHQATAEGAMGMMKGGGMMPGMDHGAMGHGNMNQPPMDHSGMNHGGMMMPPAK